MSRLPVKFILHMQCENCMRNVSFELVSPAEDDAPTDIDELLDSQFLAEQRFKCRECDSAIGVLVGVNCTDEQVAA